MRKNQKYTKEEMYLGIEMWQESGLSQYAWCKQNDLSRNTFKYWLNKYRSDKKQASPVAPKAFLPVEFSTSSPKDLPVSITKDITIAYPTGTKVICPANIEINQLRALIKL